MITRPKFRGQRGPLHIQAVLVNDNIIFVYLNTIVDMIYIIYIYNKLFPESTAQYNILDSIDL